MGIILEGRYRNCRANMILVAHELGLGTCWIAHFDEGKIKDVLGIPKNVRVIALLALGYPAVIKGSVIDRKSLDEIIHYERWQKG
jgi:nitroreductase